MGSVLVHARRHLPAVDPHEHAIDLQVVQLLDRHLASDLPRSQGLNWSPANARDSLRACSCAAA